MVEKGINKLCDTNDNTTSNTYHLSNNIFAFTKKWAN